MALDLRTGQTIWQAPSDGSDTTNLTYDTGRIFVLNSGGLLQAYNADVGNLLWDSQLEKQAFFYTPPTAANGRVFATGDSTGGTIYAVDEQTGALRWSVYDQIGDGSIPAIGDGGVFLIYPSQYYRFDPATGKEVWHYSSGDGGGGRTPVYYQNRLYIRDSFDGDFILDPGTGMIVGAFASDQPPAFWRMNDKKSMMLCVFGGQLYAVDSVRGNVQWSFQGDGQLSTPPW
jgi:outer membrane protein assembly factor BamB